MNEQDKTHILARINILTSKNMSLEKRILELETSKLSFRLKKTWNRVFSVLYAILTTAESGETLWIRLKMFSSTMWAWIRSGFKVTDELNQIARLEICKICPQLTENNQCKVCGCLMTKKVKIAEASCPLKKW